MPYFRYAWNTFPDAVIHADENAVRSHPSYKFAKTGCSDSAFDLIEKFINRGAIAKLTEICYQYNPILISAHALERDGVNAIPEALANALARELGWDIEHEVVQANIVSHTKADGFSRLARQATFEGKIENGRNYILVDDFIGQGGTLANLRGWVINQGGATIGATVLTGKSYSAKLSIEPEQIDELRKQHGQSLEEWWKSQFGFGYECLTHSEARYLIKTPTSDRIRNQITKRFQA